MRYTHTRGQALHSYAGCGLHRSPGDWVISDPLVALHSCHELGRIFGCTLDGVVLI